MKDRITGAVSSSSASTERLRALGIRGVRRQRGRANCRSTSTAPTRSTRRGYMVKGGGAALTREKIVAAQSRALRLHRRRNQAGGRAGRFPLPVEVIPMATQRMVRAVRGAWAARRRCAQKDGKPLVTDNGQHILDVTGLSHRRAAAFRERGEPVAGRGDGGRVRAPEGRGVPAGHGRGREDAGVLERMPAGLSGPGWRAPARRRRSWLLRRAAAAAAAAARRAALLHAPPAAAGGAGAVAGRQLRGLRIARGVQELRTTRHPRSP